MRWVRFVILLVIATVLQAGLLDRIALADLNIKPDLLLILLVFFAVHSSSFDAIITSFSIGFASDLIGWTMGPGMISFGLFGTLLVHLHRVIAIQKMAHQSAAIFVTSVLAGLLVHVLSVLKSQPAIPNIYAAVFGTALYSAIVGPFLFLPSAWWMRIKTHRFSNY